MCDEELKIAKKFVRCLKLLINDISVIYPKNRQKELVAVKANLESKQPTYFLIEFSRRVKDHKDHIRARNTKYFVETIDQVIPDIPKENRVFLREFSSQVSEENRKDIWVYVNKLLDLSEDYYGVLEGY